MIKGMHAMFYTTQAAELRAFFRDKLGLSCFDSGGGWLIFDMPAAEIGMHPTDGNPPSGHRDVSFYCDDVAATRSELEARGVEFTDDVHDEGYGLVTHFAVPGGFAVKLYQPAYTSGGE